MRAGASFRMKPQRATLPFLAVFVCALLAYFSAPVWAADDEVGAPGAEQPAEIAPGGDEEPADDNLIEPDELDPDVFMRPDVKAGGESAPPPHSAAESKQDKLDLPPDDVPLPAPIERPKALAELYEQLGHAPDAQAAAPIMAAIEEMWHATGSATVDLLMSQAVRFTKESDLDLALKILDAAIDIAPEEAEAWYLRAKVHYLQKEYELSLADLRHALDRDPKHYRALDDLGVVLEALGTKKEALQAYRKALQVNPFLEGARQAVEFLSREVGGRDI
jgi:predicted negative regulator of RcsB-dependent stress response